MEEGEGDFDELAQKLCEAEVEEEEGFVMLQRCPPVSGCLVS